MKVFGLLIAGAKTFPVFFFSVRDYLCRVLFTRLLLFLNLAIAFNIPRGAERRTFLCLFLSLRAILLSSPPLAPIFMGLQIRCFSKIIEGDKASPPPFKKLSPSFRISHFLPPPSLRVLFFPPFENRAYLSPSFFLSSVSRDSLPGSRSSFTRCFFLLPPGLRTSGFFLFLP